MPKYNCWIEIDQNALIANFQCLADLADPGELVPIVKSNAYGHGLEEVFYALKPCQPGWYGINSLPEGALLRKLGFSGRILMMGPIFGEDLHESYRLGLDVTIGNEELLDCWLALSSEERPLAHFKIDTGLSRQGFKIEKLFSKFEQLSPAGLSIAGISSHFASVEDCTHLEFAQAQLAKLQLVRDYLESKGCRNILVHIASSASALIFSEARLALTRAGISLYGFWPSTLTQESYDAKNEREKGPLITLQPVLSWNTRVANVRQISAGSFVGYGCTYQASIDMTIALLPVGYYEGYPRLAAENGAYVLIGESRCPIIGRICMNMMTVDVSQLSSVELGEAVTLIGKDGCEQITAEQLADWAQTIQYEIVTRINSEIPRIPVSCDKR